MNQVIDLANVAPQERAQAWAKAVRDEYLNIDIRFPGPAYPTGHITRSWFGAVSISSFVSSCRSHERTKEMAAKDGVDWLVGALQLQGSTHIEHVGRETNLKPGHLVMLDVAEISKIDFLEENHMVFITVPRALVLDGSYDIQHIFNVGVDEKRGSTLIIDYFRNFMSQCDIPTMVQRTKMVAFGVRLLVDAAESASGYAANSALREKVLALRLL